MAATCDTPVGSAKCDVQAVGRCSSCNNAFCPTHQARNPTHVLIDQCSACLGRQVQAGQDLSNESGAGFLLSGSAQELLRQRGIPTVDVYEVHVARVKKWYGYAQRRRVDPVGRGWLVGEMPWEYNDEGNYGGSYVIGSFPTVLLDEDCERPSSVYYNFYHLIRTTKDSEGAGYISHSRVSSAKFTVEAAAEKIKGLIA